MLSLTVSVGEFVKLISPVGSETVEIAPAYGDECKKLLFAIEALREGDVLEIRRKQGRTIRIHGAARSSAARSGFRFEVPEDIKILRNGLTKKQADRARSGTLARS